MITGDHAVTAEAIAHQLGIEGRAITGAEFRAMSDDEAMRQIDGIGVIARVSPEDKVHLVDILRKKGHVVGMTGDGVNDAPALKTADIGIAMGITGTEVSKQAAVMILTDDNYATIVKAVGLGRSVYDNLMRFIRFQMAGLFGFIATFLGSSFLNILGGIPFLPLQTLWLELHGQRVPGHRPGLRQASRGSHGDPAATQGAADHAPPADDLARRRRARHGRRNPRRARLGETASFGDTGRPHDGGDHVRACSACSRRSRPPTRTNRCSAGRSSPTARSSSRPPCPSSTILLATELGFLQRILGTREPVGRSMDRLHRRVAVADRRRGSPQDAEDPDRLPSPSPPPFRPPLPDPVHQKGSDGCEEGPQGQGQGPRDPRRARRIAAPPAPHRPAR